MSSYITNSFLKDIFFTQLAIVREEELFDDMTIINSLKLFLRKAFILHLQLEIARLENPRMDNHHTLQEVKELDYLTSDLIIPNSTQKNATNQVNISEFSSSRRRTTRRSHR